MAEANLENNIDDLLAYLVSPEYLRMTADQQGEWNWQNAADPRDLTAPVPVQNDGLAQWERELLEGAPVPIVPTPVPQPVNSHPFGIRWNQEAQQCDCTGCRNRRRIAETPSLTGAQRPVRLRSRTDGWERFADVIEQRRPFTTSTGHLRGTVRPESTDSGYLRSKHAAAANLWQADQDKIDYVVYSYQTPIAWHVKAAGVDEWIYPDVRYSRTTSAHQNKIRAVIVADPVANSRYLQPEA